MSKRPILCTEIRILKLLHCNLFSLSLVPPQHCEETEMWLYLGSNPSSRHTIHFLLLLGFPSVDEICLIDFLILEIVG
jgi:hypothetical protein